MNSGNLSIQTNLFPFIIAYASFCGPNRQKTQQPYRGDMAVVFSGSNNYVLPCDETSVFG